MGNCGGGSQLVVAHSIEKREPQISYLIKISEGSEEKYTFRLSILEKDGIPTIITMMETVPVVLKHVTSIVVRGYDINTCTGRVADSISIFVNGISVLNLDMKKVAPDILDLIVFSLRDIINGILVSRTTKVAIDHTAMFERLKLRNMFPFATVNHTPDQVVLL